MVKLIFPRVTRAAPITRSSMAKLHRWVPRTLIVISRSSRDIRYGEGKKKKKRTLFDILLAIGFNNLRPRKTRCEISSISSISLSICLRRYSVIRIIVFAVSRAYNPLIARTHWRHRERENIDIYDARSGNRLDRNYRWQWHATRPEMCRLLRPFAKEIALFERNNASLIAQPSKSLVSQLKHSPYREHFNFQLFGFRGD